MCFDEAGVTFRYKDYRRDGGQRPRVMTLATDEFIRRLLLHVLPRRFHRIRHYGLLAASARKVSLARARELLTVAPPPADEAPRQEPRDTHWPCPCCGGQMAVVEIFARWCHRGHPLVHHAQPKKCLRDPARTKPRQRRSDPAAAISRCRA